MIHVRQEPHEAPADRQRLIRFTPASPPAALEPSTACAEQARLGAVDGAADDLEENA